MVAKIDEVKSMAMLIAEQEKQIASLTYKLEKLTKEFEYTLEGKNKYYQDYKRLEKEMKELGNKDTIAALLQTHQTIMAENKLLHDRVDAAFAGVGIDESARKHQLQSIVERLDGIKASVEAAIR